MEMTEDKARVASRGATQTAGVLLAASGGIHLALTPAHQTAHALFFPVVGAALVALATALWFRPARWTGPAFGAAAGLVALYGWTRVVGLPGGAGPDTVDTVGLFTKALEAGAIAALVVARSHGRASRRPPAVAVAPGNSRRRRSLALATAATLVATALTGPGVAPATAAVTVCPTGSRANPYRVVAMPVDIVYNEYGDHNPNGRMYALEGEHLTIKNQVAASPNTPVELVRPLVIRANRGDCLTITLKNELDRPAGYHVQGLAYDVTTDDGSFTGDNPDSTVPPGETRTYTYYVPSYEEEGSRLVEDLGDPRGGGELHDAGPPPPGEVTAPHAASHKGSMAQGLYGTVNVLPQGSTWTDPRTGSDMFGKAGPNADIHIAGLANDFREYTLIGWDETDILTKDNQVPVEANGAEVSFFGFNYRTEPLRNRATDDVPEASNKGGDTGDGEELAYNSWAHGDPATPVLQGYKGDPAKIRIVMAGSKETHIFHLHEHRWRNEPKDPKSTRIDSQSWSPGQSFSLDLEGGVGSQTGSAGDSIFHCHLYPHFVAGFWGLLRSHDVLEDGSRLYPDGTKTPKLVPLPDRTAPPGPTLANPGYPHYIPGAIADTPAVKAQYPDGRVAPNGKFGHRPPQTPLGPVVNGVNDRRGPFDTSWRATGTVDGIAALSPAETAAFPAKKPGAPYVDPCPSGSTPRKYEVSLIQRDIVYNDNGWHDPNGRMFVLKEDEAAVLAGTKAPEPLVIRANKGDCVDFEFTNNTPLNLTANDFQSALLLQEAGMHVHLVKFDVLGSDGASNGWNYDQAVLGKGGKNLTAQTQRYRWMVDTDIKSIFWHDHAFAGAQQQHGVFAGMIQEPTGSTWRDPKTGAAVRSGWRADIVDPNGPDFREFAIFAQDFAPVLDKDGKAVNPPAIPDDTEDYGVSAVNYRNEPFQFRRSITVGKGKVKPVDPSYVYSSKVHGDPFTPLMEAYRKDPVKIRLFQGAFEEQHSFSLHGARWKFEPDDPTSSLRSNQTVGLSEAFNFEAPSFENCGTQACKGDYLYRFNDKDSTWLGAWGIFRAHKFKQDGKNGRSTLLELPDQPAKAPADTNNVDNDSTSTCGDGILTGLTGTLLGGTTCLTDSLGLTKPPDPGKTFCPSSAPVKKFSVVALQTPLVYNTAGDTEDAGMVYALAADEAAIKAGTKKPEPLMIRVNKGDCAEVTLTNRLPTTVPARNADDPRFEADDLQGWGPSNRASIHASGLLKYEVNGSDGATVGKNSNQTVDPGESITQRWYADEEVGAVLLEDMGDQLNHRFRGLFGGLVVEPPGSTYSDPVTNAPLAGGTQAIIRHPVGNSFQKFREFGLFLQDGLTTLKGGATTASGGRHPMGVEDEPEDGGDKGYNYTSAPFSRRLTNPADPAPGELASMFSSTAGMGAPATPLWQAIAGDPVRIRLFGSQDQRRQQSFELTGHSWPQEPGGTGTVWRNSQDAIGAGAQFNFHISQAGGLLQSSGDYRYGSTVYWRHREGGLWGLFRVLPATTTKVKPL